MCLQPGSLAMAGELLCCVGNSGHPRYSCIFVKEFYLPFHPWHRRCHPPRPSCAQLCEALPEQVPAQVSPPQPGLWSLVAQIAPSPDGDEVINTSRRDLPSSAAMLVLDVPTKLQPLLSVGTQPLCWGKIPPWPLHPLCRVCTRRRDPAGHLWAAKISCLIFPVSCGQTKWTVKEGQQLLLLLWLLLLCQWMGFLHHIWFHPAEKQEWIPPTSHQIGAKPVSRQQAQLERQWHLQEVLDSWKGFNPFSQQVIKKCVFF